MIGVRGNPSEVVGREDDFVSESETRDHTCLAVLRVLCVISKPFESVKVALLFRMPHDRDSLHCCTTRDGCDS
jgi:hypothetical protein